MARIYAVPVYKIMKRRPNEFTRNGPKVTIWNRHHFDCLNIYAVYISKKKYIIKITFSVQAFLYMSQNIPFLNAMYTM